MPVNVIYLSAWSYCELQSSAKMCEIRRTQAFAEQHAHCCKLRRFST